MNSNILMHSILLSLVLSTNVTASQDQLKSTWVPTDDSSQKESARRQVNTLLNDYLSSTGLTRDDLSVKPQVEEKEGCSEFQNALSREAIAESSKTDEKGFSKYVVNWQNVKVDNKSINANIASVFYSAEEDSLSMSKGKSQSVNTYARQTESDLKLSYVHNALECIAPTTYTRYVINLSLNDSNNAQIVANDLDNDAFQTARTRLKSNLILANSFLSKAKSTSRIKEKSFNNVSIEKNGSSRPVSTIQGHDSGEIKRLLGDFSKTELANGELLYQKNILTDSEVADLMTDATSNLIEVIDMILEDHLQLKDLAEKQGISTSQIDTLLDTHLINHLESIAFKVDQRGDDAWIVFAGRSRVDLLSTDEIDTYLDQLNL